MKRIILLIPVLLTYLLTWAQPKISVLEERKTQIDTLLDLIRNDQVEELAERVVYPLQRRGFFPSICSKGEFIAAYPYLFAPAEKARLLSPDLYEKGHFIKDSHLAILNGDLWIGREGKIVVLALSEYENRLSETWSEAIHSDMKGWENNSVFSKSADYTFIVDHAFLPVVSEDGGIQMKHRLRFACWDSPKTFKDKPDILIFEGEHSTIENGASDLEGTLHTFTNGEIQYQIEGWSDSISWRLNYGVLRIIEPGKEMIEQKGYPVNIFAHP